MLLRINIDKKLRGLGVTRNAHAFREIGLNEPHVLTRRQK